MDKLLTISIAAYNVSSYIADTLNSLIVDKDCLNALDIIVVNDGSKDDTLDIATNIAKNYPNSIRVIDKPNSGYGSTVNTSIEIAKGKYFRLLDGDDLFESENVREYLEFLKTADSKMILSPYYTFYQSSTNTIHKDLKPADINNPIVPTITIETNTLKKVYNRLSENILYTDAEYTFNAILAASSICTIDIPTYIYRLGRDGQSVSLESIKKNYTHHITVSNRICSIYEGISNNKLNTLSETQINLSNNKMTSIIHDAFQAIALNGTSKLDVLKDYDQQLKVNYPRCYEISNKSKKVYFIRLLNFKFYALYCRIIRYLFIKKNPHSI